MGKAMKGVWYEYCHRCQKLTLFRHLDCADCKSRGEQCPIVLCTECGDGHDESEKYIDCSISKDFLANSNSRKRDE